MVINESKLKVEFNYKKFGTEARIKIKRTNLDKSCRSVCVCVCVCVCKGDGLEKNLKDQSGYQYGNEIRDKPSNG